MKKILLLCGVISFVVSYGQERGATQDSLLKITDSTVLKAKIAALEKGDENDLQSLAGFYNSRKKFDQAQVVYEIAAERFPASRLAFQAASGKIRKEPDAGKRMRMFVDVKKNFAAYANEVDYQMMTTTLAQKSIDDQRMDEALFYMESIKLAPMYASIARGIYAIDSLKGLELVKNYLTTRPQPVAPEILRVYTYMLVRGGNLKEAAPYAREAYAKSKWNAEFLNDYVKILHNEGDHGEIVKVLETAVLDGLGSAEVKQLLMSSYKAQGLDSNASFELVMERYREKLKGELAKKIINKPSPSFVLKDEKGRTVSLSDFKGKTIVLDFWATWCIPCKKSFPAMQMAVDKYKRDKSVKFLFIHTWERGSKDPLLDASTYLKQNKYSFDLYMDYKDPGTEKNPAVSAFGVTGIPTKYVIDANGNIRFKVDGFFGADEAAKEEVVAMIEMVKGDPTPNAKN